jgi:hypothetical protein
MDVGCGLILVRSKAKENEAYLEDQIDLGRNLLGFLLGQGHI